MMASFLRKRLSSLVHLSTFLLLEALLYWLKKYMKTIRVGHYNFLKIMVIGQNVQVLAFIPDDEFDPSVHDQHPDERLRCDMNERVRSSTT